MYEKPLRGAHQGISEGFRSVGGFVGDGCATGRELIHRLRVADSQGRRLLTPPVRDRTSFVGSRLPPARSWLSSSPPAACSRLVTLGVA